MGTPITPLHLVLDEDAGVGLSAVDCKSVSVSRVILDISVKSDDFKLFGVVLIEEGDGHAHDAVTSSV